jgi:3-hydroxypropanoate dehydrogenase
VVLGVLGNPIAGHHFERRQRCAVALLAMGLAEESPYVVLGWSKHWTIVACLPQHFHTSMNVTTEQLFDNARSHNRFAAEPVPDETLRRLYELMKWGPTSSNCCPVRIVFVRSPEAKEKLVACMNPSNVDKTRSAPVVAVIGMDMTFYDQLPKLFPHADARSWFAGKPELITATALRNSSLQGGYFIIAARALGIDCGPMGGFDAAKMDAAFFGGTTVQSSFVCALGRGQPQALHPRGPRLAFDEACRLA